MSRGSTFIDILELKKQRMVDMHIYVPLTLAEYLKEEAGKRGMKVSELIRRLIVACLNNEACYQEALR